MPQELELRQRVTLRPDLIGGRLIVRDMRIAEEHVLANRAAGESLHDLPDVHVLHEWGNIEACLLSADRMVAGEQVHDRLSVGRAS